MAGQTCSDEAHQMVRFRGLKITIAMGPNRRGPADRSIPNFRAVSWHHVDRVLACCAADTRRSLAQR